jgi:hypothetical protein
MDWTLRGVQCVVRLLDGREVSLGAILAIWMMSDDNDHLGQNDRQVKLCKPILMGHQI